MFLSRFFSRLRLPRLPKLSIKIPMWKTFYIKPGEIGILYNRSDFKKILTSGTYTYFGRYWRVQTFDLKQPEANIENLELLLRDNAAELEENLLVVRTSFNQAGLVRIGQRWVTVLPNQLRAFWRGFIEVEAHIFNLEESLEIPQEFVRQLRGFNFSGIKKILVKEYEIGLLYVQNNFVRPLEPGEYAYWALDKEIAYHAMSRLVHNPQFPLEEVLIERHPEFVAVYCEVVQTATQQVAIVRYQEKAIAILSPTSRKLFWQGVDVEIINISEIAKLSPGLVAELVSGKPETINLSRSSLHICQVPAQHIGLLYVNQEYQTQLDSGIHAWWVFGRSFRSEAIDLRLQNMEVSGQDILSKDKVPLRLNLTAGFRIQDALRAKNGLSDFIGYL